MTRILEVEENGTLTLPPDVLGEAKPHTRYVVEAQGEELTLRPEQTRSGQAAEPPQKTLSPDEWWAQWNQLVAQISHASTTNESAVEILSEMRR